MCARESRKFHKSHKSHKSHKKPSFEEWLVLQKLPQRVWTSQYIYVENGILVDIRNRSDSVGIGSLQYCCDPRYAFDDANSDEIDACEDASEDAHESLLKSESGGMYAW